MDLGWERSFRLEIEQRGVFGLDIGSSSVNVVQLRKKGGGWVVTAAGRVKFAPSQDNENRRRVNTIGAIYECLESTGIQARMAVCGVSGPPIRTPEGSSPAGRDRTGGLARSCTGLPL